MFRNSIAKNSVKKSYDILNSAESKIKSQEFNFKNQEEPNKSN